MHARTHARTHAHTHTHTHMTRLGLGTRPLPVPLWGTHCVDHTRTHTRARHARIILQVQSHGNCPMGGNTALSTDTWYCCAASTGTQVWQVMADMLQDGAGVHRPWAHKTPNVEVAANHCWDPSAEPYRGPADEGLCAAAWGWVP